MKKENLETTQSNSESLKYSGDITVSILDGDRVLSKEKYHNTGCPKLFECIASCLAGSWSVGAALRPVKIVAFKEGDEWNEDEKVSTSIVYDRSPEPKEYYDDNGNLIGWSTLYTFRLPYLCLVNGAIIKKMALYPNKVTNLKIDRCAYYVLPAGKEIKVKGGGNFTIIIEWKLNIMNK